MTAGIVFTGGGETIAPRFGFDVTSEGYPSAMDYFDQVLEVRTGVSKAGQGLDANALQNQTATSVNQVYDAAQAKVKLIARIFAETGIRDLFRLLQDMKQVNVRESPVPAPPTTPPPSAEPSPMPSGQMASTKARQAAGSRSRFGMRRYATSCHVAMVNTTARVSQEAAIVQIIRRTRQTYLATMAAPMLVKMVPRF